MKHITVSSYPNREIRVTLTQEPHSRFRSYESNDGIDEESESAIAPSCHSVKTRNSRQSLPDTPAERASRRAGFGRLGRSSQFSTYGRRKILRAGGALESAAPCQECLFLTVTLPGSTREAFRAIAEWSGYLVHRLKAWVAKWVKSKFDMYVWEWQRRGALHLHYVVWCPDRERGEYIRTHLSKQWINLIDRVCKLSQVDLYRQHQGFSWNSRKEVVRTDAQWCEKSVAAYLSKYVSKQKGKGRSNQSLKFPPSRWYGVSRPLLALLRTMTKESTLTSISNKLGFHIYEESLSILQSFGLKCYEYRHRFGDGKTIVAYLDKHDLDSIWTLIMNHSGNGQSSSTITAQTLKAQIRSGVFLMLRYPTWRNTWSGFAGDYLTGLVMKLRASQPITELDYQFLLDQLAYTFRYTEKTRSELPGECKLWYSQTKKQLDFLRCERLEIIGSLKM